VSTEPSAARAARLTIALGLAAGFCEGIDLQGPGVAAPGIRATFMPTAQQMGSFLAAGTLGLFIGAVVGGWLADRIGRRRVLACSVLAFGVFSILNAWAPTYEWLYWARFLTGLGLGGALPMLVTMVAEASAPERRSANVAMAYAGLPIGGILVSIIASSIAPENWRTIFVLGGVVPIVVGLLMMFLLPESSEFSRVRAAGSGAARADAGNLFKIMAEGRALPTLVLWVTFFLGLLILYLLLTWLPLLMTDNGLSSRQAAMAQIGFNVGGAVAALSMGRLLAGRWRMPSVVAAAVGIPLFLYLVAHAGSAFGTVAACVLLLGVAVLALQAFFYASAPTLYPTWIRGVGVGAVIAVGRVGSYVGPKVGGYLKGLGHSSPQLLMDLMPIAIAGSAFALLLALFKPRHRD